MSLLNYIQKNFSFESYTHEELIDFVKNCPFIVPIEIGQEYDCIRNSKYFLFYHASFVFIVDVIEKLEIEGSYFYVSDILKTSEPIRINERVSFY